MFLVSVPEDVQNGERGGGFGGQIMHTQSLTDYGTILSNIIKNHISTSLAKPNVVCTADTSMSPV